MSFSNTLDATKQPQGTCGGEELYCSGKAGFYSCLNYIPHMQVTIKLAAEDGGGAKLNYAVRNTQYDHFFKYSSIAASNFSMSSIWISPMCAMRKVDSLMGPYPPAMRISRCLRKVFNSETLMPRSFLIVVTVCER